MQLRRLFNTQIPYVPNANRDDPSQFCKVAYVPPHRVRTMDLVFEPDEYNEYLAYHQDLLHKLFIKTKDEKGKGKANANTGATQATAAAQPAQGSTANKKSEEDVEVDADLIRGMFLITGGLQIYRWDQRMKLDEDFTPDTLYSLDEGKGEHMHGLTYIAAQTLFATEEEYPDERKQTLRFLKHMVWCSPRLRALCWLVRTTVLDSPPHYSGRKRALPVYTQYPITQLYLRNSLNISYFESAS